MQLSYRSASLEGANFHFATFVYRSADRLGNKKKHIYKQLHHGQWLNKIGWTIGDEITWKPRLCSQWLFSRTTSCLRYYWFKFCVKSAMPDTHYKISEPHSIRFSLSSQTISFDTHFTGVSTVHLFTRIQKVSVFHGSPQPNHCSSKQFGLYKLLIFITQEFTFLVQRTWAIYRSIIALYRLTGNQSQ